MKPIRKLILCFVLALSLLSMTPTPVRAWGAQGHRIVALVASKHLTTKARQGVARLLGGNDSDPETVASLLADVANFADAIRNSRQDTKQFHFVDIPVSANPNAPNSYNPARDCPATPEGDCVIAAIERFRLEVADTSKTMGERGFALKMIVHLVGDMHQPLHCADRNNDRGGNNVKITWFGRSGKGFNLHAVWDKLIIEEAGLDDAEFAEALEAELTPQTVAQFQQGTVIQWAEQSHKVAQNKAYGLLPNNRRLGQNYYNRTFAVVDEQLTKGGVRLAKVLNELFP